MDIRIFCDESCHLPNDGINVMVLGAIWCQKEKVPEIRDKISAIKAKHGLPKKLEIKWTKVSPGKVDFYIDLARYFFSENDLHFRSVLICNKDKLNHKKFDQDHDAWYYKMFYNLLKPLIKAENRYEIFLDIKDTRSCQKVKNLQDVLCNDILDFDQNVIKSIQALHSDRSILIQLSDLLMGSVGYYNRGLTDSKAKIAFIEEIKNLSKQSLKSSTPLRNEKFNLFFWQPDRSFES